MEKDVKKDSMKILVITALKNELIQSKSLCEKYNVIYQSIGVGKKRVRDTLPVLLDEHHPELVIFLGGCGALVSELRTGDVIIPSVVLSKDNLKERLYISDKIKLNNPLLKQYNIHSDASLISATNTFNEKEKLKLLSKKCSPLVVDMESFTILRICQEESNVKCIIIKSVIDTLNWAFPKMDLLVETSETIPKKKKMINQLFHPIEYFRWKQLQRANSIASQNNFIVLEEILRNLQVNHSYR